MNSLCTVSKKKVRDCYHILKGNNLIGKRPVCGHEYFLETVSIESPTHALSITSYQVTWVLKFFG